MKNVLNTSISLVLFILLSIFSITACVKTASSGQDSQQAREMMGSLVYFGIIGGPGPAINISTIESSGSDWVVIMDDASQFTIDKSTNILHCIKPPQDAQRTCGVYITIIDSAVIMDTKSFSCVPLDSNSMDCKPEILDKYKALKARFLAQ